MKRLTDLSRRQLLTAAAATLAWSDAGSQVRPTGNTQFSPLKRITAGMLDVAYAEMGPSEGPVVLLLHGWPYDIHTYVDVAPILAALGFRALVPYLRGFGPTRFLAPEAIRNGQQAAFAVDAIAFLDALNIDRVIVAGCDWGARTANVMAALWPERCRALVSVSGYLIGSQELNRAPLTPTAELKWWYQYYFATERGAAGYRQYTRDFARLIWSLASPTWKFHDATFERSAAAFDNPDHVAITLHNYRWRLGLAAGEPRYDDIEHRLALLPAITVPTITLEGDANSAPHPAPASYARRYTGKYEHRTVAGGTGHNLPQEAPLEFSNAVLAASVL